MSRWMPGIMLKNILRATMRTIWIAQAPVIAVSVSSRTHKLGVSNMVGLIAYGLVHEGLYTNIPLAFTQFALRFGMAA